MSRNCSLDEMLDQIQMETAPWTVKELTKNLPETSFFDTLNCTEEPFVESCLVLDKCNTLKEDIPKAPHNTLVTKMRDNRRSSIFPVSEEPTAFKFHSLLNQLSDFGMVEEPERMLTLKEKTSISSQGQCQSKKNSASTKFKRIFTRIKKALNLKKINTSSR